MPLDQNASPFDATLRDVNTLSCFKNRELTLTFNAQSFGLVTEAIRTEMTMPNLSNQDILEMLYQEIKQDKPHAQTAIWLLETINFLDKDCSLAFYKQQRSALGEAEDNAGRISHTMSNVSVFSGMACFGIALAATVLSNSVLLFGGCYFAALGLLAGALFLNRYSQSAKDKARLQVKFSMSKETFRDNSFMPSIEKDIQKVVRETMVKTPQNHVTFSPKG